MIICTNMSLLHFKQGNAKQSTTNTTKFLPYEKLRYYILMYDTTTTITTVLKAFVSLWLLTSS